VLATADAAGRPWSSPVHFAHRLYRATVDAHWVLAKDGRPDHRVAVQLGAARRLMNNHEVSP
jgi:hypothetical protein